MAASLFDWRRQLPVRLSWSQPPSSPASLQPAPSPLAACAGCVALHWPRGRGPPRCYSDVPPLSPARAVTGWRAAVGLTGRPVRGRNQNRARARDWSRSQSQSRGRSRRHSRASRCRHWDRAHPSVTCTSYGSGRSPRARSRPAACAGPPASTAGWGRRARRPTVSTGRGAAVPPDQPPLRPAPHGALLGGRLGKAPRCCQGRLPVGNGRACCRLREETGRTILTWCLDLLPTLWSR